MNEQPKKEEGFFTKLWNKTVFADMVSDAKEEKAMKRELKKQAMVEAKDELKEEYKKAFVEKEKARITGKGKGSGMLSKLGEEFKSMGENVGNKDIGAMMGMGGGSNISNDKIGNTLGGQTPENKNEGFGGSSPVSNEKIRRMLGR